MTAIVGLIIVVVVGLAGVVMGDLVSREARARLDKIPHVLLRLAVRRTPAHMRGVYMDEWRAELDVIMREAAPAPVTRLIRGLRFAAGLLRVARAVAREAGHAPRRSKGHLATAGRYVAVVVTLVAVWGILAYRAPVSRLSPHEIAETVTGHGGSLLESSVLTLSRTLLGLALAAAVALLVATVGAAIHTLRPSEHGTMLAASVNMVPTFVLAPSLLMLTFGFGHTPNVILVSLICVLPILSRVIGRSAEEAGIHTAESRRISAASRAPMTLKARWAPAARHVLPASRAATPYAMLGVMIAEKAQPSSGLGAIIVRSENSGNWGFFYSAVLLLVVVGLVLYALIGAADWLTRLRVSRPATQPERHQTPP